MEYNIQETEIHWQKEWAKAKVFEAKLDSKKPKFYCLDMCFNGFAISLSVPGPSGTTLVTSRF